MSAAELAILVATVCYAASALAARGLPPLRADSDSAGMLLVAAPVGLHRSPPSSIRPGPSRPAWIAAGRRRCWALFCTGLGYVLFFGILTQRRARASPR